MAENRVAICLFDEEASLNDNNLLVGDGLVVAELHDHIDFPCKLLLRKSSPEPPGWVEHVDKIGKIIAGEFKTASSGSILLVEVDGRIIGCCFGTSVANINRERIVSEFGLAVVFNSMALGSIKSVETLTLGANPMTSIKSLSRPSYRDFFGLDELLESINELSAYRKEDSRRILMKGKEFYSCPLTFDILNIVDKCRDLFAGYIASISDPAFAQFTSTKKIKDKILKEQLNRELCGLVSAKSESVNLIDYDYIDTDDFDGYSMPGMRNRLVSDLSVTDFFNSFRAGQKITVELLRSRTITIFDRGGQPKAQWSLFRCITTEIVYDEATYLLYRGEWYQINHNYVEQLRENIAKYESHFDTIPAWNGVQKEAAYNEEFANLIGGQNWDKRLYRVEEGDARGGIEFCDVLTKDHVFHVKIAKSSSLNSHLLMQTSVSASLLANHPPFRTWIANISQEKPPHENIFTDEGGRMLSEKPAYCILLLKGEVAGAPSNFLPFFSLVSFNFVIRRISQLGFEVFVLSA